MTDLRWASSEKTSRRESGSPGSPAESVQWCLESPNRTAQSMELHAHRLTDLTQNLLVVTLKLPVRAINLCNSLSPSR